MNAYDVFKVITTFIDQVLKENPDQVDKYKKGKKQLLGFFVGQVMKNQGEKQPPKWLMQS